MYAAITAFPRTSGFGSANLSIFSKSLPLRVLISFSPWDFPVPDLLINPALSLFILKLAYTSTQAGRRDSYLNMPCMCGTRFPHSLSYMSFPAHNCLSSLVHTVVSHIQLCISGSSHKPTRKARPSYCCACHRRLGFQRCAGVEGAQRRRQL